MELVGHVVGASALYCTVVYMYLTDRRDRHDSDFKLTDYGTLRLRCKVTGRLRRTDYGPTFSLSVWTFLLSQSGIHSVIQSVLS